MPRSWVPIALITLLLGLGLASQTAVTNNKTPSRPAKPRVVATVVSLDPRGSPPSRRSTAPATRSSQARGGGSATP
jgi:hypothetical protein